MTESQWAELWDKRSLRAYTAQLQAFSSTEDRLRWGSRTLPHPKPWEWEAQRHVRALVQQYQAGDLALLRLGDSDEVWGVHHVRFKSAGDRMVVKFEVIAAARHMRGPQPPHIGDELYDRTMQLLAMKIPPETSEVILAANIHKQNRPSQDWAKRHDFEPAHAATLTGSDYEQWVRRLASSND